MSIRPLVAVVALLGCTTAGHAEVEKRAVNGGKVVLEGAPEVPIGLSESLDRFQNVRSAFFGDWSLDGGAIYVRTRFGNVTQLHRVEAPGGARRQLTFFREPVEGVVRRPGSDELLLRLDEGGDERYQYLLFDPGTGTHRRLTDGVSRNSSATWSPDGRLLAFTSTRRDGRSNDVWVIEPERPEQARLVLEATDGAYWSAGDFSGDGRRLLVEQYRSRIDSRVHLLDLETGERRLLLGGDDAPASYSGVGLAFDAADRGFFFASDEEGEFERLGHCRIADGAVRWIAEDSSGDVESFELSDDATRAAFVVNENGVGRLYLLDPASLEWRSVEGLPPGLVSSLEFDSGATRLAMRLNTARTPSDVFVLAVGPSPLESGDLERWTYSEVGGLDTESFVLPRMVAVPSFDGLLISTFVYEPAGAGPHPVVVLLHGGPESQHRPGFRSYLQAWVATLGVAVVAPNVRGSSGYGKSFLALDDGLRREDALADVGAILDWIADQPSLDAGRVAVYGGSYGGYLALASLVRYGDRLRAGVDLVGISDFVTFLENTEDYRRDRRRAEYGDERDPETRRYLRQISPAHRAAEITVPVLVAQGENDPRVPASESDRMVEELRAAGREVWYMKALDEGHGFEKKVNRDLFRTLVVLFLERHLLPVAAVAEPPAPAGG